MAAISIGPTQVSGFGDPISVGTYNMLYKSGAENYPVIEGMAEEYDIFGLQEAVADPNYDNPLKLTSSWCNYSLLLTQHYAVNSPFEAGTQSGTHDVFIGEPKIGGSDEPEYSPIFYDNSQYELIEGETVELHGQNFNNEGGTSRIANFVVLRDKQDGSTVLVANTHWSNTSEAAHEQSRQVVEDTIADYESEYSVDGVIVMGDFNTFTPDIDGMRSTDPSGIDQVLVSPNMVYDNVRVMDGGVSDHDIFATDVYLTGMTDTDPG